MSGKVILIAMDGSEHSNFALRWCVENIAKHGDTMLLAHCANYHNLGLGSGALVHTDAQMVSRMINEKEKEVKYFVDKMERQMTALGVEGRVIRLAGDPGHAITEAAISHKVDMIVTGCRGQGQVRRTLLGSVSSYILHHAHVPVMVCRHHSF